MASLRDRLLAKGATPEMLEYLGEDYVAFMLGVKQRERKPDFIAMVKRAQEAGIDIKGVNITADGVALTLGSDRESDDATITETADELRKLI